MHQTNSPHLPVMVEEALHYFKGKKIKTFFEGTLGAGGHAQAILTAHPEIETYIGCDRDEKALALAKGVLEPWKAKTKFVHGNFADLDQHLAHLNISNIDGFFLIWGSHLCN